MKTNIHIPQPLRHKIFLTPLLGAACLVFGLAAYLGAGDRTLLILSGVLFIACACKGVGYYRLAVSGRYETVCGTCVRITSQLAGRLRKISLMDDRGIEMTLSLPKQHRIAIGSRYRFYFTKTAGPNMGSEYLNTLLSTGAFLGFEQIEDAAEISAPRP